MLSEAGAEVAKFERPTSGEDARYTGPKIDGESIGFAVLNHGKKNGDHRPQIQGGARCSAIHA